MKRLLFNILIASSFIISNEIIEFTSANPFSFRDIITNLKNQENQDVFGILRFPDNFDPNQKYPLIIGVAGSLDWSDHHFEYLEM